MLTVTGTDVAWPEKKILFSIREFLTKKTTGTSSVGSREGERVRVLFFIIQTGFEPTFGNMEISCSGINCKLIGPKASQFVAKPAKLPTVRVHRIDACN